MTNWSIDETRILSAGEIGRVLDDLRRRAVRSVNSWQNLLVFRLATCCGLRASEIVNLEIRDVRCETQRPYLNLRRSATKGHKARRVPLWWDAGTLRDLQLWRRFRTEQQDAEPTSPFVCCQADGTRGNRLDRQAIRKRFIHACKVLGAERQAELTTHMGRHSFVSHMLKHRTLAEVQQAAGHSSPAITGVYVHVAVDDDGEIGQVFGATG